MSTTFYHLRSCKTLLPQTPVVQIKQNKTNATRREELREQHALGEEIGNAITSTPLGEPIDEDELDQELDQMEQENLTNKMLETGQIPVTGEVGRIPSVPNGPGEFAPSYHIIV
jgi:charged multivesicular body protein 4A/B